MSIGYIERRGLPSIRTPVSRIFKLTYPAIRRTFCPGGMLCEMLQPLLDDPEKRRALRLELRPSKKG